jgi:hypothetical protein
VRFFEGLWFRRCVGAMGNKGLELRFPDHLE